MRDPTTTAEYLEMQRAEWSEAEFQTAVIEFATDCGWIHYHTHDSRRSVSGFPDLVLVHVGRRETLFRELKSAKGVVSDAQKAWMQALEVAGQDATIWWPKDWEAIESELSDD